MPLKGGRLTPQEAKFADVYALTGDVSYSAQKATYKDASAGHHALRRPAVADRVASIREAKLADCVGMAYDRLAEMLLPGRSMRDADKLGAIDKAMKAGHQYQPSAIAEKPVEERSPVEMLEHLHQVFGELVEVRPGEYVAAAPVPVGGVFD